MRRRFPLVGCAMVLAACTGVAVDRHAAPELAALRQAGYRIAVMPFTVSASMDGLVSDSLAAIGDALSLEATRERPMREQVGQMVAGDVVTWLQQSDFDVIDPWHVGTQLDHAGIPSPQASDPAHVRAVARATGADGVVYGDLQRWNRGYYVLQSVVEVGLRLRLVDAASGQELFATTRTESIGSGLTGGPTGYTSAATAPIAGLRGSNLRSLTHAVTRHAVADLNGGELGNQAEPTTPRLAIVALAKEHDGPFRAGERVDVIAIGSADGDVRFDLGRLRTEVPMRQAEHHDDPRGARATYLGHYIVASTDVADELPLTCVIARGRSRRTVALRYRWDGTLSLAGDAAAGARP